MSDTIIAYLGLGALALLFALTFAVSMRRRQRLWFVGTGRTSASRLASLRALQMRELRDLEDGHDLGKISDLDFEDAKESLLLEIAATTEKLNAVEAERESLKQKFNLPAFLFVLFLSLLAAPQVFAQEALQVKAQYQGEKGSGRVRFHLKDKAEVLNNFRNVVVVALELDDNDLPFDERTQGSWTGMFRRIADIDPPSGLGDTMSIKEPGAPNRTPTGYAWASSDSGTFEVSGLMTGRRLAFAAHLDGMWWPFLGERVLEGDTTSDVPISISAIDDDLAQLAVSSYIMNVAPAPDKGLGMRWHQVDVLETIIIDNPTSNAISGRSDQEGVAWLNFLIPAPPKVTGSEMLNMMASSWGFLVGEYPYQDESLELDEIKLMRQGVAPYQPWSKGLDWGSSQGGMHGGAGNERQYHGFGAKSSGAATHPLSEDGKFVLMGPGDIAVAERPNAILVNIYKPVPARSRLVIRLSYKAGMSFLAPEAIRLDRSHLPVSVQSIRPTASKLYSLKINGKDFNVIQENQDESVYLSAPTKPNGLVVDAGDPLILAIAPTNSLVSELGLTNKLMEDKIKKEEAMAEALRTQVQAGMAASSGNTPNQGDEPGLQWSSILWLLAVLFGIGFFVSLVWIARADEDAQLEKAMAHDLEDSVASQELAAMQEEVADGRLPAKIYLKERNRIIERLISAKLYREKQANKDKKQS